MTDLAPPDGPASQAPPIADGDKRRGQVSATAPPALVCAHARRIGVDVEPVHDDRIADQGFVGQRVRRHKRRLAQGVIGAHRQQRLVVEHRFDRRASLEWSQQPISKSVRERFTRLVVNIIHNYTICSRRHRILASRSQRRIIKALTRTICATITSLGLSTREVLIHA